MEPIMLLLERIAIALERLEKDGIVVILDPDNVTEVLKEVKSP
jgi:hypothetical protein